MTRTGMKLSLITLAIVMTMSIGCATTPSARTIPHAGTWTIVAMDGAPFAANEAVEVRIENNRIMGRGPVNTWSAPIDKTGRIGTVIATRMAGPPDQMKLEQTLHEYLQNSDARVGPDRRLLILRENKVVVEMRP